MQVPDPIDEPQAYQQHLLGLLGDPHPPSGPPSNASPT